jgi:hypothetical protein
VTEGRVYFPGEHGGVLLDVRPLPRLLAPDRLSGEYAEVRNGACVPSPDGTPRAVMVPCAVADAQGDFLYMPGRGGARMDRCTVSRRRVELHVEASHFAEVNTYYHLDRIAHYINGLLTELKAPSLPRVVAVVHAHNGCCHASPADGKARPGGLRPFQGGHYRLPSSSYDVPELSTLSPTGEIHLGSGQRRLKCGALAQRVGKPYRHNAGHNAGIIYHEFGHHINCHTADFRANALRDSLKQSNRKVSMDEGTSDYWSAVMLGTPHIWSWHRRHDAGSIHRRSLATTATMSDYDHSPDADPHRNGTIWAGALWDLRCHAAATQADGAHLADKIVLQSLLLIGQLHKAERNQTCRARSRFRTGLRKLLLADQLVTGGQFQQVILNVFNARGIHTWRSREVAS